MLDTIQQEKVILNERRIVDATIDVFIPQSHEGRRDDAAKQQAGALFTTAMTEAGYNMQGAIVCIDVLSFTFEAKIVDGIKCWAGLVSCKATLNG